jgi:hypothetical protein
MKRTAFLAELRAAILAALNDQLAMSPWRATIDTSVDQMLASYREKSAGALERAIRAEAPEAASCTDARGYIPVVCAHVRARVQKELESSPAPDDAASGVMGVATAAAGAVVGAVSSAVDAAAGALSSLGNLLFKRKGAAGGAAAGERVQLARGRPLEADVRSRMEGALGGDFGGVRIHDDQAAARAAGRRDALAFTLGTDVAFGSGQYRPGTPVGDALLAHELAHVMQQRTPSEASPPEAALEADADTVATAATTALWDPASARAGVARARLRSGLSLQRCTPARSAPTDPHGRYQYYLEDGAKRLAAAGFGTPLDPDFKDHFDKRFWDWEYDETYSRRLRVKDGKRPSDAMDAMFDDLGSWRVDCDHLIQIAHLWAMRNTFPDQFDTQAPTIELRPRGSTGLKTRAHYGRNGPGDAWFVAEPLKPGEAWLKLTPQAVGKTTEQLVDEAPVGSRVRLTNLKANTSDAFRHENSLKLGPDRFAAAGFTRGILDSGDKNVFSLAELQERLAKNQDSSADRGYMAKNVFVDEIEHFDTP